MADVKPLKPYLLRRWKFGPLTGYAYFFTCARPGRTGNIVSKDAPVRDEVVHRWLLGLPGPNTAIVSLLGRKPDGLSEFSFYSFYGGFDDPDHHSDQLSFEAWLEHWHKDRCIVFREHPTCDLKKIDSATLENIAADIKDLVSAGRTVILVDSGGQQRTGQVCRHMGAVEDSSQLA